MKNLLRRVAALGATALVITILTPSAAHAAEVTLTVHYTDSSPRAEGAVTAELLDGTAPLSRSVTTDAYGEVTTFTFDAASNATLAFTVGNDSLFPDDVRYIQAVGGSAEVWLIDGDPRVYGQPILVPEAELTDQDDKVYIRHTALASLLGVWHPVNPIANNGYVFDGHANGSTPLLTIYYQRSYHEIAIDHDRVASNTTTSMLNTHATRGLVFRDIDGFKTGTGTSAVYHISFGSLERLLQVGTLVHPGGRYLLQPQSAGHATLAEATPQSVGFTNDFTELRSFANEQIGSGYPAIAVSVVKDGKLVFNEGYGWALKHSTSENPDGSINPAVELPVSERVPATKDTIFDLASNSKMYATNYAIQRLVSQGLLDIDQRISTFPGWENFTDEYSVYSGKWTPGGTGGIPATPPAGKANVTVRQLLNHVGGMIPDPEYPNLVSAGDGLWYQTDNPYDRAGIIDAISKTPLRHTPGTTYAYSDVDYMILGLLVEQVSGQPLDEYLEQEFYGPLGLTDTMFRPLVEGVDPDRIAATELNGNTRDGNVFFGTFPDSSPVPQRAYTLRGEVHDEKAYYSMAGVAGHAGLFSTTADMAVLTQLMLNGGVYDGRQYFTKEVAEQFVAPFVGANQTANATSTGLGWRIHSFRGTQYYYFNWGASRDSYGHQGWTGTLTVIDPVHKMTVTILTTRIHAPVTSPPNGFGTAGMSAADLVPFVGYVYKALNLTDVDYIDEASVAAVAAVDVAWGSSASAVEGQLPRTVTVTDDNGDTHRVPVEWDLSSFSGTTVGPQAVVGTLLRPAWLRAASTPLAPQTQVTALSDVPIVSAQPSDTTVTVGGDAVFTVAGDGVPAPTIQWQSSADGIAWNDIAGATGATLTVSGTTLALSGTSYRAVLTNPSGSVETAAAVLTVTAASGGGGGSGEHPATGAELSPWLIGLAALLLLGGAVLLLQRRRARTE